MANRSSTRHSPPLDFEIESARALSGVIMRAYLIDGTPVNFTAFSWMTVRDATRVVAAGLGIVNFEPFGLFMVEGGGAEGVTGARPDGSMLRAVVKDGVDVLLREGSRFLAGRVA